MRPAALAPAGLPGLDPAWSRLVEITDADGVRRTFQVLDSGAGPAEPVGTLLCVHGNPTWSYLWRRLVANPPAGWRVIAPDQLGMGYSERIDRPRVLAERVDDLSRLTDALGVTGPVVTVAHDWGGIVSLGWAQAHRDQLRGLVLTNTAVHQPAGSKGPILIRLAHVPTLNRIACRWTPLFVRTTTSLTWPRPPKNVRDAFAAPYSTPALRLPVSEFVADIPFAAGHPSRGELDRIAGGVAGLDVPAVLLWGPRDPVFLEEHLLDLQQRLPRAGVHRFEKASHLLPQDAPEYVDAVHSFVGQLRLDVTGRDDGTATESATTGRHRTAEAAEPARPTELAELLAREHDTGPAVVEVGGRSISWAELFTRVRDTGAGLVAAGVKPGDRVALLVPPSIELTVSLYAVWRAGGVIVVVDKGLGLRGMGRALRSARVDHLIADTPGLLAAGPMRVPGGRIATRTISAAVSRLAHVRHTLPELAALGRASGLPAATGGFGDEDQAAVIFTSGATGPAKGVLYRHRQVRAQIQLIRRSYAMTAADRIVAAFAPFALYGPALGITSAVPATDVTKPGTLTAAALAEAALLVEASVVFASPAALTNVLATADELTGEQQQALAGVRLLMSAGAPVPAPLLRRLTAVLPNADMHTPYGMTEGLPLTDISLAEIEAAGSGDGVCVGRPLPGVELLIAPLDRNGVPGAELTDAVRVSGEIWVRANHIRDRYDTRWLLDRAAAAHPGWHRTGDVGALDEAGRLWVQGRLVHVLSTADGPVTPVGMEQRVQDRLAADGADSDTKVAVVGVGPDGTQQVVVVLTGPGGPLAAPATRDAARAAAGVPVAAVLIRKSLPVDIRHNSKIDRVEVANWAGAVLSGGNSGLSVGRSVR
ncbi:MAG: alpha/beta fold hydrolase [Nakamurella sp.]